MPMPMPMDPQARVCSNHHTSTNNQQCWGTQVLWQVPRGGWACLWQRSVWGQHRATVQAGSQHTVLIIAHHSRPTCQVGMAPVIAMLIGTWETSSRTTAAPDHAHSTLGTPSAAPCLGPQAPGGLTTCSPPEVVQGR
jgi:hypothetical protein